MHNEDNFDYAIELAPEEEYREIAAKTSHIIDFSDLNLNELIEVSPKDDDEHSVSTFDSSEERDDQEPSNIDQKSFLKNMYRLSQRKLWVETVSRRSSLLYQKERFLSDEEIRIKFVEMLVNGVQVRRHQANKFAEKVSLFGQWTTTERTSDTLFSISWEPEESSRIRKYLRGRRAEEAEVLEEDGDISEWTLENCARFCGCGDNLFGGVKENQYTGRTSISRANIHMDRDYQESILTNRLYNYGFLRRGSIKLPDLIAVQPASNPDPTNHGEKGTRNFRESLDVHNPHLSLAVVSKSIFSFRGVTTLDIECDDEHTYQILLSGFSQLMHSSLENNVQRKDELKKQKSEVMKRVASELESVIVRSPKRMISNAKSTFFATTGIKLEHDDPIERMFFPDLEKGEGPAQFQDLDKNLSPPAQFLGWNTKGTQIWARLRMAGLEVKPVFSWDLKRVILKIRCPEWRLEEVAEKMHVRLRLRNGGFKRFKISQRDHFATTSDGLIFRSSERQRVIDFILRSKIKDGGAELDENTTLGQAIVQRFPLHMKTRLEDLKNSWVFFWRAEQPGEIPQPWSPFSAPFSVTLNRLCQSISYFWNGLLNQPLDQIAEYYGESIAFYFAWVAFFTRWLFLPSILGLIVFAVQISSKNMDHWICIPYGVFIVIWCSLMLVFWRQKQSALAYRWGVLGFEMEETERPQFKGSNVFDAATQEMRKVYPPQRRLGKYLIAAPIMLFLTGLMLLVMTVVLFSQEKISKDYTEGKDLAYMPSFEILYENPSTIYSGNSTSSETPNLALGKIFSFNSEYWMAMMYFPSMYGLIVSIVSEFVDYAALKLTDFENHRKESTYGSRLILKIFCFRFVAVFTPVYYYAFFVENHEEAYVKMFMCILALVTVGDWWKKFLSTCLPAWIHRFQMYRLKLSLSSTNRLIWDAKWATEFASVEEKHVEEQNKLIQRREHYHHDALSSVWGEALKQDFTVIEDYTLAILQLGFVLLFGIVFPLGPIIALFNNLFFIRIDAAKLMFTRKRPIAKKIGGLGVWEDVLQIMSVIGILTNCCLMLFTSTRLKQLFPFLGVGGVAVLLFAYEHTMLFLKYFLHSSVNRVPASVQRDQERNRLLTQKRKFERNDRQKRTGEENFQNHLKRQSLEGNGNINYSEVPQPLSRISLEETKLSRRGSIRSESATLAADPFEFQSESCSNSPQPVNCIGEINFSQYDNSKRSLSPLFDILRLRGPECNFSVPPQVEPDDSSSSSDSESYSHKSIGRYTLPRSLNHVGGPGPATFGSMNQLLAMNAPNLKLKVAPESRRETLMSESVASFDENDEECWRVPCLAQIDTLASTRKPLGPERIQCVSDPRSRSSSPALRRCSTLESSISSLTGPSWPGNDEFHLPESSPSKRASLLQVPLEAPPPKPIREFRKPSLGVQSASPSLRRGQRSTPPNSSKTTPESAQSIPLTRLEMTPNYSKDNSPKVYSPPSAPLPKKPDIRLPPENSLPVLPLRPGGAKERRTPQRRPLRLSEDFHQTLDLEKIIDKSCPTPVLDNAEEKDEDCENSFIESNNQGPFPITTTATPMPPNNFRNKENQQLRLKPSSEVQLNRPKLGPKKRELGLSQKKTADSPSHRTPTKTPQSKPKGTPSKVAEAKPTFQQRMESWLRHSDHSPEAPNPFLEVLKDR